MTSTPAQPTTRGFAPLLGTRHIHLPETQALSLHSLPSTSPANAAWRLPALVEAWAVLIDALNQTAGVAE